MSVFISPLRQHESLERHFSRNSVNNDRGNNKSNNNNKSSNNNSSNINNSNSIGSNIWNPSLDLIEKKSIIWCRVTKETMKTFFFKNLFFYSGWLWSSTQSHNLGSGSAAGHHLGRFHDRLARHVGPLADPDQATPEVDAIEAEPARTGRGGLQTQRSILGE